MKVATSVIFVIVLIVDASFGVPQPATVRSGNVAERVMSEGSSDDLVRDGGKALALEANLQTELPGIQLLENQPGRVDNGDDIAPAKPVPPGTGVGDSDNTRPNELKDEPLIESLNDSSLEAVEEKVKDLDMPTEPALEDGATWDDVQSAHSSNTGTMVGPLLPEGRLSNDEADMSVVVANVIGQEAAANVVVGEAELPADQVRPMITEAENRNSSTSRTDVDSLVNAPIPEEVYTRQSINAIESGGESSEEKATDSASTSDGPVATNVLDQGANQGRNATNTTNPYAPTTIAMWLHGFPHLDAALQNLPFIPETDSYDMLTESYRAATEYWALPYNLLAVLTGLAVTGSAILKPSFGINLLRGRTTAAYYMFILPFLLAFCVASFSVYVDQSINIGLGNVNVSLSTIDAEMGDERAWLNNVAVHLEETKIHLLAYDAMMKTARSAIDPLTELYAPELPVNATLVMLTNMDEAISGLRMNMASEVTKDNSTASDSGNHVGILVDRIIDMNGGRSASLIFATVLLLVPYLGTMLRLAFAQDSLTASNKLFLTLITVICSVLGSISAGIESTFAIVLGDFCYDPETTLLHSFESNGARTDDVILAKHYLTCNDHAGGETVVVQSPIQPTLTALDDFFTTYDAQLDTLSEFKAKMHDGAFSTPETFDKLDIAFESLRNSVKRTKLRTADLETSLSTCKNAHDAYDMTLQELCYKPLDRLALLPAALTTAAMLTCLAIMAALAAEGYFRYTIRHMLQSEELDADEDGSGDEEQVVAEEVETGAPVAQGNRRGSFFGGKSAPDDESEAVKATPVNAAVPTQQAPFIKRRSSRFKTALHESEQVIPEDEEVAPEVPTKRRASLFGRASAAAQAAADGDAPPSSGYERSDTPAAFSTLGDLQEAGQDEVASSTNTARSTSRRRRSSIANVGADGDGQSQTAPQESANARRRNSVDQVMAGKQTSTARGGSSTTRRNSIDTNRGGNDGARTGRVTSRRNSIDRTSNQGTARGDQVRGRSNERGGSGGARIRSQSRGRSTDRGSGTARSAKDAHRGRSTERSRQPGTARRNSIDSVRDVPQATARGRSADRMPQSSRSQAPGTARISGAPTARSQAPGTARRRNSVRGDTSQEGGGETQRSQASRRPSFFGGTARSNAPSDS